MKRQIQKLIQQAIKSAYGVDFDAGKIKIDYPPEGMGNYSTNTALLIAKEVGKSPMEVAEKLVDFCRRPTSSEILDVGRLQVAKPGFINFYLSENSLQLVVVRINEEKNKFGDSKIGKGKKIHLDFVSANPTGPVHIGNARGGPLGDALANVFQKAGYKPYREYYVNDTGNQVEILGHSILGDEQAQYSGDYVAEIKNQISKIKDKDAKSVGEDGVKIILEEIIKPSMEKFGIKFDNWFSEEELQESGKVDEVINILKEKDFVYEKDGALWFKSTQFGDDKDRVVVKSTGEKTYFGSDIAYHKEKFGRGFDKLIDIWGADHHGEVRRMKGALEALGYKDKLEIILTQFVRVLKEGKEMKMSKRAGTYVSVDDLIDEVGCDATRFFFLMHSADTHMTFDLDLAKERSEKNPVYYVQYAHARIASILRKAEDLVPEFNSGRIPEFNSGMHSKERALIFELLKFPDLVEEISQNYAVHYLPQYAMGLADKFHSFYDECRVIDESNLELTAARLELVKAMRIVLAETLGLMGISAPEKM
ncbi:MAG: arginine--tRNA ligase [Patescibacteria group bacterium]|nr:arginine--tRNA ligase [Patescibacteria group bacterium]